MVPKNSPVGPATNSSPDGRSGTLRGRGLRIRLFQKASSTEATQTALSAIISPSAGSITVAENADC